MTKAQVVETSVIKNNILSEDYPHPDDHTLQTTKKIYIALDVCRILKVQSLCSVMKRVQHDIVYPKPLQIIRKAVIKIRLDIQTEISLLRFSVHHYQVRNSAM